MSSAILAALEPYLRPEATTEQKLALAQGMLPFPIAAQIPALAVLAGDPDGSVRENAKKTLLEIPANILAPHLKDTDAAATLDFFARERWQDEVLMEPLLLNPHVPDATYVALAQGVSEKLATLIMNNQVRLLKNPEIANAVKKNPQALRSAVDMMVSFLRINGIAVEGESAELSDAEIREILAMQEPTFEIPPDLVEEETPDAPLTEAKRQSIYQAIQGMSMAKKIKTALTGNKEARNILIKDANKLVCSAVVKNARISDAEILNICNMRTVHEECIRIISNNNQWLKGYAVQVALANNPKTPFPVALKFTRQLRVPDLQKLAKNKNAPQQLVKIAKELYETKKV